jgi:hypothetical protein
MFRAAGVAVSDADSTGIAIEGVTKHPTSPTITLTKTTSKPVKGARFVADEVD